MKDQLSALIDGEFDVENAEHLIKSVKSGGELKDCWQHYHLIGDAMRSEMVLSQGFTERVMNALNEEPTVLSPHEIEKPSVKTSYFKSNQIWSVAASVAAVMFVGLMLLQQQSDSTQDSSPVEIAQSMPLEYLEAHHAAAPNGAAYYIQNVNHSGAGQ
ncbi:MAG: anti-sigma 24 factor [Methylotenera sp.]|nr:MAG: anti-sigma 24 factor [Methylotenera sp.]